MTCWSQLSGRHHRSEQPEHQRSKPSPVLLLPRPKLTTPAHSLPAKGAGVAYFGPAGPGSGRAPRRFFWPGIACSAQFFTLELDMFAKYVSIHCNKKDTVHLHTRRARHQAPGSRRRGGVRWNTQRRGQPGKLRCQQDRHSGWVRGKLAQLTSLARCRPRSCPWSPARSRR